MSEFVEWIDQLNLPVVLNIVLLGALITSYLWFRHKLRVAEAQASARAKFLEIRLRERYDFMKDFYYWFEEFDHCVEHLSEGHYSPYRELLEEFRGKLRAGARNSLLHSSPEFPDLVEEFTDVGSDVSESWDWTPYIEAKRKVQAQLEAIAGTIPR